MRYNTSVEHSRRNRSEDEGKTERKGLHGHAEARGCRIEMWWMDLDFGDCMYACMHASSECDGMGLLLVCM